MSRSARLAVTEHCSPDREVNILLLGQTGVGKSAFINSLANYLIQNTLEEAVNNALKVVVPTSVSVFDPETFEERSIFVGDVTNPPTTADGQRINQQCRSYVFPMHGRNLRIIDTPGMGDTKGSDDDRKHLFEILSYTSHYEHLNGICLFLKPNEERLNIAFRLFLKQILHYLNATACANILFVFTNVRSTFYVVGNSKNLLKVVIRDVQQHEGVEIPLSKDNTFLLDNETFAYIAMTQHGLSTSDEQVQAYKKSWDHTGREYARLLNYILKLPLHGMANTLSLSASEQLIRRLSRPVAETLRLILKNIQLAKEYKHQSSEKQCHGSSEIPQHVVTMEPLGTPRLICTNEKCVKVNDETQITYEQRCHKGYHPGSVAQDTINKADIIQCKVFDQQTGICSKCHCPADNHMYITYKYQSTIAMGGERDGRQDHSTLSETIDRRINALRAEQARIEDIYRELARFLHVHAIHAFRDDMLDYLRLFVREERMKIAAGATSNSVMDGLAEIISKYEADISTFTRALAVHHSSVSTAEVSTVEQVFLLVGSLYRLPIYGTQFRREVNHLESVEDTVVKRSETQVDLPEQAVTSKLMNTLTHDT